MCGRHRGRKIPLKLRVVHPVCQMGQVGMSRTYLLCGGDCLVDAHVGRMFLVAKRIKDQDLQAVQERETLRRYVLAVCQVGESSDTIPEYLPAPMDQGNSYETHRADRNS